MNIICFLKGIWHSIINMQLTSGHNYIEIYDNKDIQILQCELCSHISLGFKGDKEQEEYTLTKDEEGTTQINGEWYRVDKK